VLGNTFTFKVMAADTNDAYSAVDIASPRTAACRRT